MTTFFIMFLAFSHSTAINKMNTTPPKMLNQFPYNLRVCLVHGFVPVSATFILAAILFAQSKALRRAFLAFSVSIYQKYDIFSPVLLQWKLYKRSRKYATTGIELSSFQKAIERTIPPDVLAHGLRTHDD